MYCVFDDSNVFNVYTSKTKKPKMVHETANQVSNIEASGWPVTYKLPTPTYFQEILFLEKSTHF